MFEQYATILWVALAWLTVHAVFLGVRLFFSKDRVSRLVAYRQGVFFLGALVAMGLAGARIAGDWSPEPLFREYHPFIASLLAIFCVCGMLAFAFLLAMTLTFHLIAMYASWGASDEHVRSHLM